ncbi:ABC transporter ATP-binding protein [Thiomonas sp.]|uniref:ABC transporter ATP-binding protein n=1 Tax=Thiomonas sp. TaxID=2047785 RepID=UPI002612E748|nr:ABC transporter ATP-binding protein [Thiomonas sp.]
MATLQLQNVRKSFGNVKVLHDVSIDMADGEFLVLVGPSGCGKSTLMNMIAGLEEPTGGNVVLAGRDITNLPPADRNISMVFQSYALYPNMTVEKNIEFPLRMRKVEKSERARRVQTVASLLQIEHLLARKPRQLSGGQRQRVAIGRALAREPQLYLFDEPLSNLDAQLRLDMRTEIKKLHQRLRATIVYVTHDQIEAMTLATRIAVMKDGVVQQVGTPHEVYNRPANTFVAGFMGSPRMNLTRARVLRDDAGLRVVYGADGAGQAVLHLPDQHGALAERAGEEVIVGLRAEAIGLAHDGVRPGPLERIMDVTIEVVEPTGADTLAVFSLGGQELTARLEPDLSLQAGHQAHLLVDLSKIVFFDPKTEQRIG